MEQMKGEIANQKMQTEAMLKKELMALEFQFNMELKNAEVDNAKGKEQYKEDRKDERTKIQASQQSELINQRQNDAPPKKFESSGNDNMSGFDLGSFGPM